MVGMIAAINSIVSHTLNPVFFHLVTPDTDIEYLRQEFQFLHDLVFSCYF